MANELVLTYTGSDTPYVIIRKQADMSVWRELGGLTTYVEGDIGLYDLPLTNFGGDVWARDIPASMVTNTDLLVLYYEGLAGGVTVNDLLLRSEVGVWDGFSFESEVDGIEEDTEEAVAVVPSTRRDRIVETMVKPLLGYLTRVKVWDEHLRPTGVAGVYTVNYKHWTLTREEIRHLDDNLLDPSLYVVDRANGKVQILDTTLLAGADFFATYSFNYFADVDLGAFVDLALAQINATAEQDTHLNSYDLDTAPSNWDGPIALYTYMRALETVLMDSMFWQNFLIFQDGAAAQGLLEAEINRVRQAWDEMRRSVKRVHLLAEATMTYEAFRISGIGSFNTYSHRLRGFRSNRIGIL